MDCCGWNLPRGETECGEVMCQNNCNTTPPRNINSPVGGKEYPEGVPKINRYVNVQLDNGECIYMKCMPPFCPYPLCTEINPHG